MINFIIEQQARQRLCPLVVQSFQSLVPLNRHLVRHLQVRRLRIPRQLPNLLGSANLPV